MLVASDNGRADRRLRRPRRFTTFTEAEADAKASQLLIGFQHDAEWSCASTAGA
jgi:hypothetical protein